MHLESTVTEIQVPSVVTDFEPGDKVACAQPEKVSVIGTVVSVADDSITINIAKPGNEPFHLKVLASGSKGMFRISRWRKVPDETLIQPGSILSTNDRRWMATLNEREFFKVTTMVPGQLLVMHSLEDHDFQVKFDDFAYGNLDEYLQYWELED